jgi:hypothetical protein
MKLRYLFIIFGVIFLLPIDNVFGQWKKLFTFPVREMRVIRFLDDFGHGEIGYVGTDGGLWRTSDNGLTWQSVTQRIGNITEVVFKDLFNGWFVVKGAGGVYRTQDGGLTWTQIVNNSWYTVGIYYHSPINRLFVTVWNPPGGAFFSDDDGITWTQFEIAPLFLNSFAFVDNNHGILSSTQSKLSPRESLLRTSDGGLSWSVLENQKGCWQPLAVKGTSTFFYVSEYYNTVSRSDDFGASWNDIATVNKFSTGCLGRDRCGNLYMQHNNQNNDKTGVSISLDDGINWQSIGGPPNDVDTKLYARGLDIYAGEHGGNLWLLHDSVFARNPVLTLDTINVLSINCKQIDTTIFFSIPTQCFPGKDSILNASFGNCSMLDFAKSESFPREFNGIDSIKFSYNPSSNSSDRCFLSLKLFVGGITIDTMMQFTGNVQASAAPLVRPSNKLDFIAKGCLQIDTTIYITSMECISQVDSLLGITFGQNASYSIALFEKYPRGFLNVDSIKIIYHPTGIGFDTSSMTFHFLIGGKAFDETLSLSGVSSPQVSTSVPKLSIRNGNQFTNLVVGNDTSVALSISEDIPKSFALDSMKFGLQFNSNLLHLDSAGTEDGLTIMINEIQPGSWNCTLHNLGNSNIFANKPFAYFYFSSYLTLDTISTIVLRSVYSYFDPNKHIGCPLSIMPQDDSVSIMIAEICGDNIIRKFMLEGLFPELLIYPNLQKTLSPSKAQEI